MDITSVTRHIARSLFVYMSLAILTARSECPPDAAERAQQCIKDFYPGRPSPGPSAFITEGSAHKAIHGCANGGFLTAVNCIERIKAQCEHDKSDPAHYLRSMFDADKVREAVKYLCTNVKVYVHNADCIRRHHNLTTACTRESFKNFKTLAEANPNMDARIRYQCTFFETAVNCSVETVKTKCSPAAADIVGTVIRGLEPPRCSQITYSVSSGRKGEEDDGSESSSNGFNRTALLMPSILTLIASKLLLILLMY